MTATAAQLIETAAQLTAALDALSADQYERATEYAETTFGVGATGLAEDVRRDARQGYDSTADLRAVLEAAR